MSNGVLTEKQREFIEMDPAERDEKYDTHDQYRFRRRIKQRLREALVDFRYLSEFDRSFQTDDLADVFDADDGDEIDGEAYLPSALEFVARAQDTDDEQIYPGSEIQPAFDTLTDAVEKGVERYAAEKKEAVVSVDVSIDVTRAAPPEAVLRELETTDRETTDRLRKISLLEAAGVDPEEIAAVAEEYQVDREGDE